MLQANGDGRLRLNIFCCSLQTCVCKRKDVVNVDVLVGHLKTIKLWKTSVQLSCCWFMYVISCEILHLKITQLYSLKKDLMEKIVWMR